MELDNPNEPVVVVTDKDDYLIHVGHPETFDKKLLGAYAIGGYNINTITITEFREKEWTWIYDKDGADTTE